MSQLDDFRKALGLDSPLEENPDKSAMEETDMKRKNADAGDEKERMTPKKKKTPSLRDPSVPERTSISLSRQTFARLDSYKFWLRRHKGKNYQSYSALLDAILDEVLEADEKAAAFVRRNSEVF